MCKIIFFVLALLFICKTRAQICGCGGPPPLVAPQEILTTSQIIRPPTTIIDSSVSNALANTLQLLIVSDLIASTLNPHATVSPCMLPTVGPISEPPPMLYTPTVDIIAPRTEFVSPPCAPIVDIIRPRCSCMESLPNFYGVTEILPPPVANVLPPFGSNICGLQEIISPVPNCAPVFGPPMCTQEIVGPLQIASLSPNFWNGLTELIGPVGNFGPVNEFIYPPRFPGPCNVEYIPPPMPCGNVNVEHSPYTGVSYFY